MNLVSYREPKGRFSCRVPADWKVQENAEPSPGVTFFGPPAGSRPYSTSIAVYYYSRQASEFKSMEDYASARRGFAMRSAPPRKVVWNGISALEFSAVHKGLKMHQGGEPGNVQEHAYLIPNEDGFFAIVHSAPEASPEPTDSVFQMLLKSLQIQS